MADEGFSLVDVRTEASSETAAANVNVMLQFPKPVPDYVYVVPDLLKLTECLQNR